jgi:UDP-glucose 4-epimerase
MSALGYDVDTWDIRQPMETPMENVKCVVHLAALVRVGESVKQPLDYYDTNVNGTMNVIRAFPNAKMVFASTGAAFSPDSPYGHSKVLAEQIVKDCCEEYTIFRFYNVGGGSPTNPEGLPSNIQKAKKTGTFTIYGGDYETKDGTCVRDYIHVDDITDALVRAVKEPAAMTDYEPLGSGQSYTVKEYIKAHQSKYGKSFDVEIGERRDGDLPISEVPFVSKFMTPTKTLEEIV